MKRNKEEETSKVKKIAEQNGQSSGQHFNGELTGAPEIYKKMGQAGRSATLRCVLAEKCSEKWGKTVSRIKNDYEEMHQTRGHLDNMHEILNDCDVLITIINKVLVEKIEERTHAIAVLNRKLTEYARYTSHELRSPLARVLGLVRLMNMDFEEGNGSLEQEQLKFYIHNITMSAAELDDKVRAVALMLNEQHIDNL